MKKLTTEEFIRKAKKKHGEKYDYSLVNYKKSSEPICITCKIHGKFMQTPNDHLNGCGCKFCGYKSIKEKNCDSLKKFINKSNKIHNGKYDYSLVNYENNHVKIKIICNIHGVFYQVPNSHLVGRGCPKCADIERTIKNSFSTKDFIKIAESVHGNKYDYSQVDYKNALTKVKIICKKHGEFLSTPANHTHKTSPTGCPFCNTSKGELKIKYFLEEKNIKYIQQKTFKDCKITKSLPFDFYLPDYNLCIEYDGIQHFKPIKIFGGLKKLEYTQKSDKIKTEYCKLNNIPLIRISYKENVEKSLNNIFIYNI